MRLVVGLGNPGPKYERNRHNVGFMAVDEIVRRHSFSAWRARFQGHVSEGQIGTEKILILKPATFMNESGRAVGEALRFFKLDPDAVTVIYDELDLAPTKIKVKQGGGNGGHNGLRSIDAHVGTDYWRVRIGIGHPGHKSKVANYVLSDFSKAELPDFEALIGLMADRFDFLAAGNASDFMSKLAMDRAGSEPPPKAKKEPKPALAKASEQPAAEEDKAKGGLADQLSRWIGRKQ